MKRKKQSPPLSLFAFQDIITSVTGVFILLTLLLALELATREKILPEAAASSDVTEMQEEIDAAKADAEKLENELNRKEAETEDFGTYTARSATKVIKEDIEEIKDLRLLLEQLRKRKRDLGEEADDAKTASDDLGKVLAGLRAESAALDGEYNALKKSKRVFYNSQDESGKQVILVELYPTEYLVAGAGESGLLKRFQGKQHRDDFLKWAKGKSTATTRFVIIVHPGVTAEFSELSKQLRENGFSIGYDLLPKDRIAIDPNQGAD